MAKSNGLRDLDAFERIEIGPTRVETNRCVTPYAVVARGEIHRTELAYKYEEDVFDPASPADRNLAALIGAQVALNYGLFTKDLVFNDPFDDHDRRFIEEMARGTAREIYVNKLLASNPFLVDGFGPLPRKKLPDFLRARLIFDGSGNAGSRRPAPARWMTSPERHAVLSSGGKDSLLSFGLLREIGREVHPIYVNESGRHWYTALNAYRRFASDCPLTSRVWTDADRLYSWMLRRMPFIRPDFASVRSDEYPLRLWTVAVFLFGSLPLLRKRGIGRLVIGDEYDTTVRASYRGIPHYAGLYDQSRYFDNALSRYFRAKGFGVAQFSLLRPLSELLIEKALVERYPDLQREQVSCHAAHERDGRILPCGKCEKCRRIVGMLLALGADPQACGYTAEQIAASMDTLATLGVHQESAGARQLFHLLSERGLLPAGAPAAMAVTEHPEVMKLRFDRERAPFDTIPRDLREPLYRILLEHADGAVQRNGRVWLDVDPLGEPALLAPYRYEDASGDLPKGEADPATPTDEFLLGEMSWPAARDAFERVDVALLPIGAIAQHGPHLPLDMDSHDAATLAREVALACSVPRPLVLPLVAYGVSYHHDDFPGTLGIAPDTLSKTVYEIGMGAARQGIAKLVIVNAHGGNEPALPPINSELENI